MKNAGLVIGIVLIVVLVLALLGGIGMMGWGGYRMMGPGMMGGFGGYSGLGFNPIGMTLGVSLVFWALIISGIVLIIVWLIRNVATPSSAPSADSAIQILKMRYARGEITKEQFETMKRDLQ